MENNTGITLISVESKAVSNPVENPSRNGQFLQDGCVITIGQTQWKLVQAGVRKVWTVFWWNDSRFRAFPPARIHNYSYGQITRKFQKSPSTHIFFYYSSTPADWDLGAKVRDSKNLSQENTSVMLTGSSRGQVPSKPQALAGDGEPAVRSGQPRALSAVVINLRKCPSPLSWNHLKITKQTNNNNKKTKAMCSVCGVTLSLWRKENSDHQPVSALFCPLICFFLIQ